MFVLLVLIDRDNGMNLFERDKEQNTRDAGADSSLRDSEVRRLQQYPDNRHNQAVGHKDNDRVEQVSRKTHRDGTHDQEYK